MRITELNLEATEKELYHVSMVLMEAFPGITAVPSKNPSVQNPIIRVEALPMQPDFERPIVVATAIGALKMLRRVQGILK